ncbi:hypothetical protein ACP70R_022577 [Stipagrostis hirtigluma subsp. patula]
MPSSSPPATRRGRKKPTIRLPLKAFRSWQPPSGRDWAGLPPEMISHVFHMLDPVELLLGGAAAVCRSWRRAARDEPELWRRIDVRGYGFVCGRSHVPMHDLVRAALRRSAGRCEAFWIDSDDADDDMLLLLSDQAPSLKSLRLISCFCVTNEGLEASLNKFPLLEELELSDCQDICDKGVFEALAKSCPRLKHLRHIKQNTHHLDDREAMAIAGMRNVCSLELGCNHMTYQTMTAILSNCTHLELLIVRDFPNLTMDDALRAKCARVKIVTLNAWYRVKPCLEFYRGWCSACKFDLMIRNNMMGYWELVDDDFFPEDHDDRYLTGVYEPDTDDDENSRMLAKNVRRYLKVNAEA